MSSVERLLEALSAHQPCMMKPWECVLCEAYDTIFLLYQDQQRLDEIRGEYEDKIDDLECEVSDLRTTASDAVDSLQDAMDALSAAIPPKVSKKA